MDYEYIILSSENEIIDYEKGLYTAFQDNSFVMNTYDIIDNNRLRCKIPYDDQAIYGLKRTSDNMLIGYGSVNLNNERMKFKSAGFAIKSEDKNKKICDGLSFFLLEPIQGENFIREGIGFANFILQNIRKKGCEVWYGVASDKNLNIYTLFGFEVLDSLQYSEHTKLNLIRLYL